MYVKGWARPLDSSSCPGYLHSPPWEETRPAGLIKPQTNGDVRAGYVATLIFTSHNQKCLTFLLHHQEADQTVPGSHAFQYFCFQGPRSERKTVMSKCLAFTHHLHKQ
ncbi:hypothetical protein E2C01_049120 [Portunus trituberculatus]|uniref:Uncharacterized protein n=1 Tax=Portunus trituberculatus TaxID=210409 RepID=A0A5B7GC09_PORTR|nr:hypothetical protein [Portunus trituberculatus]